MSGFTWRNQPNTRLILRAQIWLRERAFIGGEWIDKAERIASPTRQRAACWAFPNLARTPHKAIDRRGSKRGARARAERQRAQCRSGGAGSGLISPQGRSSRLMTAEPRQTARGGRAEIGYAAFVERFAEEAKAPMATSSQATHVKRPGISVEKRPVGVVAACHHHGIFRRQ